MIDGSDVIWAYRDLLGRGPESEALIKRQRVAETLGGLARDVWQSQEYLFRARGKLSEGDVFWAYQTFLAREPERPQAVQDTLSAGTLENVILRLLGSDEFRIRNNKIFQLLDQWENTADVAVSWQVMRDTYEPDEVAFVSHQLKPGNRALDIGANIGYLTHVMAQLVGETGQVISFEPHPVLYERLAKSVAENGLSQCKLHNLALGDAEKTGELVFGRDQANFGTSQLLNTAAASGISTCSVPVRRLDDILDPAEHVDFIKIDVEGNEPLVIRGASEFLRAQRPVIMSEILGERLQQMLGMSTMNYVEQVCALGYQCRTLKTGGVIGDHFDQPGMVEFANIVFLPQI